MVTARRRSRSQPLVDASDFVWADSTYLQQLSQHPASSGSDPNTKPAEHLFCALERFCNERHLSKVRNKIFITKKYIFSW